MNTDFDQVLIQFNADQQIGLYWVLAFIMFGVALQIDVKDFRKILTHPKGVGVGLFSQFVFLPLLTYLLVCWASPHPSLALGMFLVASCPGGNISNFMSSHARANVPLSVTLTAFASAFAIVLTPLNFMFYASLYTPTQELLQSISVDGASLFKLQLMMLALPLILGMGFASRFPSGAKALARWVHPLSLGIFIVLVSVAFWGNRGLFVEHFEVFFYWVLLHNAIALMSGYGLGFVLKLDVHMCRTIALETGIQNSGLGLALVFAFFQGLGGMAMITAWWGIWHIVSGLSVSSYFRLKNPKKS